MDGLPQSNITLTTKKTVSNQPHDFELDLSPDIEEQPLTVEDAIAQDDYIGVIDNVDQVKGEIPVSVALIFNEFGQVFVSRRQAGLDYENSLEFPGGKVDQGETPEQALYRELEEEIGIEVLNAECIFVNHLKETTKTFKVYWFKVNDYFGEPYGREGQDAWWMDILDLDPTRFPPANFEMIERLKEEYQEKISS